MNCHQGTLRLTRIWARLNTLSLERALTLRRMVIAKLQEPPDELGYKRLKQNYDAKDAEINGEAQAARKLINAIIEDTSTPSDNAALARIESRIDSVMSEARRHLGQEQGGVAFSTRGARFCSGETQPFCGRSARVGWECWCEQCRRKLTRARRRRVGEGARIDEFHAGGLFRG
jgi:hypothetical protein